MICSGCEASLHTLTGMHCSSSSFINCTVTRFSLLQFSDPLKISCFLRRHNQLLSKLLSLDLLNTRETTSDHVGWNLKDKTFTAMNSAGAVWVKDALENYISVSPCLLVPQMVAALKLTLMLKADPITSGSDSSLRL
jgi:hypothetical protein